MSRTLDRLVSYYYESHKIAVDVDSDALGAMRGIEEKVVAEVLNERVDELQAMEAKAREQRLAREREETLRESAKSFGLALLEAVFLGLVVGLIGSHLYGLFEAWLFSPDPGFNYTSSIIFLVILLGICIGLLIYMFVSSVPDWVANAVRRHNDG